MITSVEISMSQAKPHLQKWRTWAQSRDENILSLLKCEHFLALVYLLLWNLVFDIFQGLEYIVFFIDPEELKGDLKHVETKK